MPTTNSYYTIVRNTCGSTRYFDFIGQRGAKLDDGADAKVPGNLFDLWAKDARKIAAIKYALENGVCQIIKTPDVYVCDTTAGMVKVLGSDNSTPVSLNPDTGSYSGAAP